MVPEPTTDSKVHNPDETVSEEFSQKSESVKASVKKEEAKE